MSPHTETLAEKLDNEAKFIDESARGESTFGYLRLAGIAEGLKIAAEMVRIFGDKDITNDEALKYENHKLF